MNPDTIKTLLTNTSLREKYNDNTVKELINIVEFSTSPLFDNQVQFKASLK